MKRKIFILIILIFYTGCTANKNETVNLLLFASYEKDEAKPEDKQGLIIRNNNTYSPSFHNRWKDIIVLYNTNKDIQLKHEDGNITIYKNSAVLVDDMLRELKFHTKIDLFNFLKKDYTIYDRENIGYKHVCEIKERKRGEE